MSSITPPSFVDDGDSFIRRTPRQHHLKHISKWIESTSSDTSAYTGSFFDDGADMLPPSHKGPGFGHLDSKFYEQGKLKEGKSIWNDNVQRAISGDMRRSLAKMRDLGGVEVKKLSRDKGKTEKNDTVTIPKPLKWGTFVIKGENGQVIIVDQDGEYDSGPQTAGKEPSGRWIQAASTTVPPSSTNVSLSQTRPKHTSSSHKSKQQTKKSSKERQYAQSHAHQHETPQCKPSFSPSPEVLVPIPGLNHRAHGFPSRSEHVKSPTSFFMTGGASGWPEHDSTISNSPIKSRSLSAAYSPPGAWPSPSLSLANSAMPSKQHMPAENLEKASKGISSWISHTSGKSYGLYNSQRSHKSSTQGFDNLSTIAHSIYKSPTVEDAPDTSSEGTGFARSNWCGSKQSSAKGWGESRRGSRNGRDDIEDDGTKDSRPSSVQGWDNIRTDRGKSRKTRKKTGHDSICTGGLAPNEQDWNSSERKSEISWDGWEKMKTISEVSVMGSGSERNSLSSRSSSRATERPATQRSRDSKRSPTSHRNSTSPAGWTKIQPRQKAWLEDHTWEKGQKSNGQERAGKIRSAKGSESKYANGYDDDDKIYLNENWGGTPVRVGCRKTEIPGWGE